MIRDSIIVVIVTNAIRLNQTLDKQRVEIVLLFNGN